jgi:hypothetical protein
MSAHSDARPVQRESFWLGMGVSAALRNRIAQNGGRLRNNLSQAQQIECAARSSVSAVPALGFVLKRGKNPKKIGKNRKNLWKQGFLLLTKLRKSRKVNGGGFSQTRINTGLPSCKWNAERKTLRRRDGFVRLALTKQEE